MLTCASAVDNLGVGSVTTNLNVKDNVYWAKKNFSLGKRQKWRVVQLVFDPEADKILPHAQPYVQRDLTWDYLSTPGNFEENACAVCALTTCEGIRREDDNFTPESCKKAKGFIGDSVEAKWDNLNMVKHFGLTSQQGYQEIYNQIRTGKPAIIHVDNGRYGHFVTAYGYTNGTTKSNITPSRILIIDPYNPERTNLQELLNHCPSSGGYDFILTY